MKFHIELTPEQYEFLNELLGDVVQLYEHQAAALSSLRGRVTWHRSGWTPPRTRRKSRLCWRASRRGNNGKDKTYLRMLYRRAHERGAG